MKASLLALLAALALALAACQGGLDSGGGGMGGLEPPVGAQGPLGGGNTTPFGSGGPTAGPNGVAELTHPGATLAPDQAQYPIGDGPTGMKCPTISGFGCTFSFNVPQPSPSPSPSASPAKTKGKAKPTPSPTPTPTPTPTPSPAPSGSDGSDDASDAPTPTPTPPGQITLQMEQLPSDVPGMTHPDMRALKIAPLIGLRLQADTNFSLDGTAIAQFVLPKTQMAGRVYALQLYSESFPRTGTASKRIDTYLGGYNEGVIDDRGVTFTFTTPKVTVKSGTIWLLVLYGLTYPPNATASPKPSASASTAPSPSASAAASASPVASGAPTPSQSPPPSPGSALH